MRLFPVPAMCETAARTGGTAARKRMLRMDTSANDGADSISVGWDRCPQRSKSLRAEAYCEQHWYDFEQAEIFAKSWQWVCHSEKLAEQGSYVAETVAGNPVCVVRGADGELRAFYNVCRHRAHELLSGEGRVSRIMCPYHAWTYDLTGRLVRAPHTDGLEGFALNEICLARIQAEEFGGFIYVNLDADARPLAEQTETLGDEVRHWAPDVERLTFAHRLTYDIRSNWKNVVDNFLECYHCPVAHRDFCTLVDMDTYRVETHGIWSSHMAEACKGQNSAYSVDGATVRDHAVWWLWPNSCLMRYPGRGNFIVMQIIPAGVDRTLETYDFFFETAVPNEAEREAIRYIDEVLQEEDIRLVESVQRGMRTPAFTQGRIVHDPRGSANTEHAVHHFHGLVLDSYAGRTPS